MWRSILAWLTIGSTVTFLLWGFYQTPVAEDLHRRAFMCYQIDPELFGDLDLVPIRWLQYLVFTVASFGVTWVIIDAPRTTYRILFTILAVVVTLVLSPTLALYGMLFEPVSGVIAILFALSLGLVYGTSEWGRRKHDLRRVFGGRISRGTMRRLMARRNAPIFHGEEQEVVILTVRIFFDESDFAEVHERSQLVELTNQFLGASSEFLCARGAYLDESSPDCIRVFFGLPLGARNLSEKACRVALELRQRLVNLALEADSRWTRQVRFGIALCTDTVVTGMFGDGVQRHYSAVGRGVDLCRRLAIANLTYGSRILVDASTYQAMEEEFVFRPIDRFPVPGSDVVSEFYELIAAEADLPENVVASRDEFWKGVVLLRDSRSAEAMRHFERAQRLAGEDARDPVLHYFLDKTRGLLDPQRQNNQEPSAFDAGDGLREVSSI